MTSLFISIYFLYQLIITTNNFLHFNVNIKINIKHYDYDIIAIPAISICIPYPMLYSFINTKSYNFNISKSNSYNDETLFQEFTNVLKNLNNSELMKIMNINAFKEFIECKYYGYHNDINYINN